MRVDSPAGQAVENGVQTSAEPPKALPTRKEKRAAKAEAKAAKVRAKAGHRHKGLGYWGMRLFRKLWLPLVILVVVAVAVFAVDRLHGVFGKSELTRPGSGLANDAQPFNPKVVVYEVFGPPGATATVNYLNLDAEPQIARDVTLPWTLELSTTAPAAAANLVAQGYSDSIGCRITVDGVVKAERWSEGVAAQTFCIVKSG